MTVDSLEHSNCEVVNWGIIGTPDGFQSSCANDDWPQGIRVSMFDLPSEVLGVLSFDEWGKYPLYRLKTFFSADGHLYTGVAAYFPAKERVRHRSGAFFGAFVLIRGILCSVPNQQENVFPGNTSHILHFLSELCKFHYTGFLSKETYQKDIRDADVSNISPATIQENCFTRSALRPLFDDGKRGSGADKRAAYDKPYYINFAQFSTPPESLLECVINKNLFFFNYDIFFSQHTTYGKKFAERKIQGAYTADQFVSSEFEAISGLLADRTKYYQALENYARKNKGLEEELSASNKAVANLKNQKQDLQRQVNDYDLKLRGYANAAERSQQYIARLKETNKSQESQIETLKRDASRQAVPANLSSMQSYSAPKSNISLWLTAAGLVIGMLLGAAVCYFVMTLVLHDKKNPDDSQKPRAQDTQQTSSDNSQIQDTLQASTYEKIKELREDQDSQKNNNSLTGTTTPGEGQNDLKSVSEDHTKPPSEQLSNAEKTSDATTPEGREHQNRVGSEKTFKNTAQKKNRVEKKQNQTTNNQAENAKQKPAQKPKEEPKRKPKPKPASSN